MARKIEEKLKDYYFDKWFWFWQKKIHFLFIYFIFLINIFLFPFHFRCLFYYSINSYSFLVWYAFIIYYLISFYWFINKILSINVFLVCIFFFHFLINFCFCCNFFLVSFTVSYNLLSINIISLFFAIYTREIYIFFYCFEVQLKWTLSSRQEIFYSFLSSFCDRPNCLIRYFVPPFSYKWRFIFLFVICV
jgi:hypothetical protein